MATRDGSATTEQPLTVIDCEVEHGQAIARIDRGDVSVLVAAPEDVDAAKIEAALDGVPKSIANAADLFGGDSDR
jgi:precorrin-4 methylase